MLVIVGKHYLPSVCWLCSHCILMHILHSFVNY